MRVPTLGHVLHIVAAVAEPPLLRGTHRQIHLVDLHPPADRIEAVQGCQLAQGGYRRTLHLEVDPLVAPPRLALVPFRLAHAPQDHRVDRDPLFRERIVRQQALVGEEVQRGLAVHPPTQRHQRSALSQHGLELLLDPVVLGLRLEAFLLLLQTIDAGRQTLALLHQLVQPVYQPDGHPGGSPAAEQEGAQVLAGLLREIREKPEKAAQDLGAVPLHKLEQRQREASARLGLDAVQGLLQGSGNRRVVDSGCGPAIETVSNKLPFEDRGRLEEDARWTHLAGQHRERIGVEIEIVLVRVGQRHGQGIAVTPAGTADPL